jgi:4-hydroxybenzoate polyprenyltransferase
MAPGYAANRTIAKTVAYARLPHFVPVVAVLISTALLARIIGGSNLTAGELIRLLLAMLGAQLVIGVTNELLDAETDARTKPAKPIPAGLVSRRGAAIMGLAGLALMLIAGSTFGWESLALLFTGVACGITYSFWFKATRFASLPYLIALPLLPIWVAVSLDRFQTDLLWLYPLGGLAAFGIQIAQSVPDVEADRRAGLDSLTTRLGEYRSLQLCWGTVLATSLLAVIAGAAMDDGNLVTLLAGLAGLGLVAIDVFLYIWRPRRGVMAAFPCIAGSAGILAFALVAAVT